MFFITSNPEFLGCLHSVASLLVLVLMCVFMVSPEVTMAVETHWTAVGSQTGRRSASRCPRSLRRFQTTTCSSPMMLCPQCNKPPKESVSSCLHFTSLWVVLWCIVRSVNPFFLHDYWSLIHFAVSNYCEPLSRVTCVSELFRMSLFSPSFCCLCLKDQSSEVMFSDWCLAWMQTC